MSVMLCGTALSFFYNVVKTSAIDFEHAPALIRDRFVTPESTRALVSEFDTISLRNLDYQLPKHCKSCCQDFNACGHAFLLNSEATSSIVIAC